MSTCRSHRVGRNLGTCGFTLIELLVVISIVALLISLLLPAIQQASRQAKVLMCATNLKSLTQGLTVWAADDSNGEYPVSDIDVFGGNILVWAGAGAVIKAHPNKNEFLSAFDQVVCGGDPTILWCPLDMTRSNPLHPNPWPNKKDPAWPLFWYDGRFGYEKYMMGYKRMANMAGPATMWRNSGNSDTEGPPRSPGSSQDAILADLGNSNGPMGLGDGQFYQEQHILDYNTATVAEALQKRRDNNVAYGDGHIETHNADPFIDADGYLTWPGAKWVQHGNAPWRLIY